MKLPKFIRAIFAPQPDLPVHRPRFADLTTHPWFPDNYTSRWDVDYSPRTMEEAAQERAARREKSLANLRTLTPEQRSARTAKGNATRAANRAKTDA